jgi:site-specific DNA-methyltransferase (adenine-specific)
MARWQVLNGNCLDVMREMDDASIDAVVTDPPYGLEFMGKEWDKGVPGVPFWAEALRVAKPGAHLLAFGGTRKYHRLACAIEDAGWEIRDCVMWVYGSGFPKSLDVSKAIDKAAGAEREVIGSVRTNVGRQGGNFTAGSQSADVPVTAPATDAARQWAGWGTALKPAWEPVIVARKPLDGTVSENVLKHGTGGLNVGGCRVGADPVTINTWNNGAKPFGGGAGNDYSGRTVHGRWPANVIHDGSDEVLGLFPETASNPPSAGGRYGEGKGRGGNAVYGAGLNSSTPNSPPIGDFGTAARFFYTAKADSSERPTVRVDGQKRGHPTVKPVDLMRYLCRLVTPPGGKVLDPFAGSGSTLQAALEEGFSCVGIELNQEYVALIHERLRKTTPSLFDAEDY